MAGVIITEVRSDFAKALNPLLGTSLVDVPEDASAEETQRLNRHNADELERAVNSVLTIPFAPIRGLNDPNPIANVPAMEEFARAFVEAGGPFAIIGPVLHPGFALICAIPFLFLPRGYKDAIAAAKERTGYTYAYIAQSGSAVLCSYPDKFPDATVVKEGDQWFDWCTFNSPFKNCSEWWVLKWVNIKNPVIRMMLPCAPADTQCQQFSPVRGLNPVCNIVRPGFQTGKVIIYQQSSAPSTPGWAACPQGYTGTPPYCVPVPPPQVNPPGGGTGGTLEDLLKHKEFLIPAGLILAGVVLLMSD